MRKQERELGQPRGHAGDSLDWPLPGPPRPPREDDKAIYMGVNGREAHVQSDYASVWRAGQTMEPLQRCVSRPGRDAIYLPKQK